MRGSSFRYPATTALSALQRGLTRREAAALLGAALLPAGPGSAFAQQRRGGPPVIGFLGATTPTVWSAFVQAFLGRLRELGWVDGRNMTIEYRWAEGRNERYLEHTAEFVRRPVDVIVTSGTGPVLTVMRATKDIPIVFAAAGDPVGTGIVASLARPGGNVTGLSNQQTDLAGNRLELLREVVPGLRRIAVLGNVNVPNVTLEMNEVQKQAPNIGLEVTRVEIRKTDDIIPGLQALAGKVDGLYVCTDPLVTTYATRINTMAMSERLPTMYAFREYVRNGGLLSYGPNFPDLFRRAGDYVDKILKGAKPADIPVEQPVKFDLIVNLTTAKAIGLTIPETFLLRANEVIE